MMALLSGALALTALLGAAPAQDPGKGPIPATPLKPAAPAPTTYDQEKMKAEYEKKLAKPFLKKAGWLTDYDKARAEAKKSGKLIFIYFTRSFAY
ncbi:MAG: hypothetical protein JNJ88_15715 [Planctomycetes bacterium]|nr:hypothetical protein [Planctomycetota bacterium]